MKSEAWRYVCVGVHAGHVRALIPEIVPQRAGRQQSTVGSAQSGMEWFCKIDSCVCGFEADTVTGS